MAARSVTTDAASASLNQSVPESEDEAFQVNLSDESFETYELDPPPYTIEVTKKELKQMYYDMVAVRYATYPPAVSLPSVHLCL
jgi:pyruvate dehydrogenase E1 component alpha subunit